jgi:deoxyribonuclease-4
MLRVREVLDALKGTGRRPLAKFLPPLPAMPSDLSGRFPHALLSVLPVDDKYSIIGLLTESLVLGYDPLTNDSLFQALQAIGIELDATARAKVEKSKTTKDYLKKIEVTRMNLEVALQRITGEATPIILQQQVLQYECVQGHPDGVCGPVVIEVKTTSKLEEELTYFLLQLFSYVAISKATHAILVLPLQQTILTFSAKSWVVRIKFRTMLVDFAKQLIQSRLNMDVFGLLEGYLLMQQYGVGTHISKNKLLLDTVMKLKPGIPYQIFLGGNQTSRLSLQESDLFAAANYIQQNNIILFVHSPYLLNLSATTEDKWQVHYIKRLLNASAKLKARGVVVHVGKHTTRTYEQGVAIMKEQIEEIMDAATEDCPFLLETPAGQGTETLKDQTEFLDFVESFNSPKVRACVDTCHVYANGQDPYGYVEEAKKRGLLRLVHFNDSQECCGSCKDRHAQIGTGKIGLETLQRIAEYCQQESVPMLFE